MSEARSRYARGVLRTLRAASPLAFTLGALACSSTPSTPGPTPPDGTMVSFDLSGTYADDTCWALPLPSDLRLDAEGAPDVSGFPNPNGLVIVDGLKGLVAERRGHALMPVGHARFSAARPA